jgi:hypothetical protein
MKGEIQIVALCYANRRWEIGCAELRFLTAFGMTSAVRERVNALFLSHPLGNTEFFI